MGQIDTDIFFIRWHPYHPLYLWLIITIGGSVNVWG